MTSRHGIFRQTDVASNVARAARVFLKLMPADGVRAVNRSGYEGLNPSCRHVEIQGEESYPIKK
jgi:hypothetical protein